MARIYGLETEYALVALSRRLDEPPDAARRLTSDDAAQRLFAPLARTSRSTNVFLPNGGRLYLDVGNHPEYATPECRTVDDLLVAERAGDEIVVDLAAQARAAEREDGRDTSFTLVKNNVDPHGNTYGSHENYLVARATDPDVLAAWLIPFLVSRQLVAGAGRWRRGTFTLSQRCGAHADAVSARTTRSRPLINTRDEPHADPEHYRRLHVISGDSSLSETTGRLKVAATELVLRLAERTPPGNSLPPRPDDPIGALTDWGHDPTLRLPTDQGALTCADLQRWYRQAAEGVADDAEGRRALADWGAALDDERVEWRVKRDLIEAYRVRHGLPADDPALDALDLRWHELGADDEGRPRGLARLLEARGALERLTDPDAVARAHTLPPSPTRAVLRGRLLAVAAAAGRDVATDWASFTVHDLTPPTSVVLALEDPFATDDERVDDLVRQMAGRPRLRTLGGFTPPPG